jgi:hypothetical protein
MRVVNGSSHVLIELLDASSSTGKWPFAAEWKSPKRQVAKSLSENRLGERDTPRFALRTAQNGDSPWRFSDRL